MKPWLNHSLQQIEQIIDNSRLPHALLISGNKNIGKLELAQNLVQKLTDINIVDDKLAIDESNDKIIIRHSHYSGLIYCQREIKEKSVNKKPSSIISVNQVRKFCDFLAKTNDKLQIGIIKYGDFLNNNSANALLKTLEEPRKNTLIIILAHNKKKLPITILSRCQKIHLNADKNSLEWIKNNIDNQVDDVCIYDLLKENNFVPKIVVNKINNFEYQQEQKWKNQLLSMAINPNNINKITDIKNNEIKIIHCLQNLVISSIEAKYTKANIINKSHKHILQKVEFNMLFCFLNDINKAKNIINTTINIKLLLDNLLIVWSHIAHLQEYPNILSDIN